MTIDGAKNAVYDRFAAQWSANSRTEPVVYENQTADPRDPDFNPGTAWLRLVVDEHSRSQVSLGAVGDRKWECRGLIMAQVFVEADTGTELLDTLLQTVRTIFEGVYFGGVDGFAATQRTMARDPDGLWYGKLMECEYRYEETR